MCKKCAQCAKCAKVAGCANQVGHKPSRWDTVCLKGAIFTTYFKRKSEKRVAPETNNPNKEGMNSGWTIVQELKSLNTKELAEQKTLRLRADKQSCLSCISWFERKYFLPSVTA